MTTKIPVELSSTPGIVDGSNATAITIDSSEKVGVGTTSPTSNLHIGASGNDAKRELRIDGTNGSGQTFGFITEADGENGRVSFKVGQSNGTPSQKLMIHPDGGITFGTDTAAANALDDYEEGTFVANPTISGASGAIAFNGTNNHLSFTKIGNVCHIQGTLQIASNSVNGGRLNITNLPFTSQNGDGLGGQTIIHAQISGGSGSQASGYLCSIGEGSTTVQIQTYTGVGVSNDSAITMAADSFLLISGSYLTA